MTFSRDQIELAYQLFLGRRPESEAVVERKRKLPDEKALSRVFLASPEFRDRFAALNRSVADDESPVVIHLHIPKTAGSSFNRILARNFEQKTRFAWNREQNRVFKKMTPQQRQNIDLIFGHMTYGVHQELRRNHINLFVLRDPKTRIYSYYKYVQIAEDHPFHKRVNHEAMSYGDFLNTAAQQPQYRWAIDNTQMLRIAGLDEFSDDADIDYAAEFRRACQHAFSETCEFGLTEEFPAYLERLKARGILTDTGEQRLNTTNSSESFQAAMQTLTPHEHELLDSYTQWDQKFYSICKTYLESISGH